ncbi:hypothetical protein CR513_27728, partial [Mucuna pruriens]
MVESKSSHEESSSNSSDSSHDKGDLLMVRRLINAQVNEESDSQRENIFHSSCINVASLRLVQKLNLLTLMHPRVNDSGLDFTLGKYSNEIPCDVVPMEATHILLCRPW